MPLTLLLEWNELLLEITKHTQYSRDRTAELQETFCILDNDKDGYLTPQDIVAAAAEAKQEISLELAQHMMTLTGDDKRVRKKEFVKFWSPADP